MTHIGGKHIVTANGHRLWPDSYQASHCSNIVLHYRNRNVIKKPENSSSNHRGVKQVRRRCSALAKQTKENGTIPPSKEINLKRHLMRKWPYTTHNRIKSVL